MVVVEAAASGLPVVLRDIHDYDHTFRGSALMCDEADFAVQLARLRDDISYRRKVADKSSRIAEKFDAEAGAHRLVELYQEVL